MSYSPARLDDTQKTENQTTEEVVKEQPAGSRFSQRLDLKQDSLIARYRERMQNQEAQRKAEDEEIQSYRQRLEQKFRAAQRLYDEPANDLQNNQPEQEHEPDYTHHEAPVEAPVRPRRQIASISAAQVARHNEALHDGYESHAMAPPAPRRRNFSRLALYAASAMIVGSGIGFGFAQKDMLMQFADQQWHNARAVTAGLLAPAAPEAVASVPAVVAPSGESTIEKKPVAIASLSVNDAHGSLNSMIPLSLAAQSGSDNQPVDIAISGLPPSAYLTAGHQTDEGRWVVKAPELDGLKLVVPQSDKPQLDLQVAAVEQTSGDLAAPAQRMSVELSDVQITPASAPPDMMGGSTISQPALGSMPTQPNQVVASTAAQPLPQPIAPPVAAPSPGSDLVAKADGLMSQGDLLSARQYYMQASTMGNGQGSYGVARTYDPKIFAQMKIEGLQADPAKAAEWYKKAQGQGITATP